MEAARTGAPLAVDGASAPSRYLLKLASDEKLVGRVRGGSEQAFAVLYERHHRSILSFCRHMLGSREEAEDALQQAFANAFRAMLGNDRELNVKPWLYRIARNQCISALRARRRDSELADDEPSLVGLSDQVAQRDELRDLLRDLAGLPVDQREALVLAELHDNSHAEVATIIGCEKEKVKSLVFQARRSLIKSREAREAPCEEIRRQLSVLRGGALRRNTIRRHLQHCEGCRAFRHEVKHQRQALAVILPVVPSVALKLGAANAMAATAAIGGSLAAGGSGAAVVAGSGATAAGGSGAAAGPLAALAGKLGVSAVAVKGAAATVAVTVAAGGGAVAVKEVREPARGQTPIASEQSADRGSGRSPGGTGEPGGVTPSGPAGAGAATIVDDLGPGKGDERAARLKARRARRGRRARDPLALQERAQRRAERRLASKRARPVPLTPDERARRKADRRKAARERRLERRQRREQSQRPKRRRATKEPGRRKPAARKPARRRAQPPVGTTPLEPAPTDPPPENREPAFPPR